MLWLDLHSHARDLNKGDNSLTPVTAWRVFSQRTKASLVVIGDRLVDKDTQVLLADDAVEFIVSETQV